MAKRKWYAYAWIAWAISFAVLEWRAIKDDDREEGDFTLSHYVRRLAKRSWLFRIAMLALLAWLGPIGLDHFNLL